MLLRILGVCSAILALVAAFQFVYGVGAVIEGQKETLIMSSGALGKLYGQCVEGPLVITMGFGFLAFTLWRCSNAVGLAPATQANVLNKARVKIVLGKISRVLSFIFLAAFLSFSMQLALGAYAIVNVQDSRVEHSLAGADYVHQLYLWLPAGFALIFAAGGAVFWTIGRLWRRA
jgi:hypothetical protein